MRTIGPINYVLCFLGPLRSWNLEVVPSERQKKRYSYTKSWYRRNDLPRSRFCLSDVGVTTALLRLGVYRWQAHTLFRPIPREKKKKKMKKMKKTSAGKKKLPKN